MTALARPSKPHEVVGSPPQTMGATDADPVQPDRTKRASRRGAAGARVVVGRRERTGRPAPLGHEAERTGLDEVRATERDRPGVGADRHLQQR